MVAAEPSAAMRAQLGPATAAVVAAKAERLPFSTGAFDAVVVGQAFHWFDGALAVAEIHRVLRPGGRVAMLWNVRDRTVDWAVRLAELTEPYRWGGPTYRDGRWRHAFEATTLFTPLARRSYAYEHEVDADTMVERMASISWIGALPDGERAGLLAQVRALFDGMPPRFPVPYHTDVWQCRRR